MKRGGGTNRHFFFYRVEGDLWFVDCACGWHSEGFDTKREAKRAHSDHTLKEILK